MGGLLCATLFATPVYAQVATGTYTGDGSGAHAITGLGFQPDVVIVKADHLTTEGVVRTSTMAGGSRTMYNTGVLSGNLITSLDADGFTVGSDIKVNGLNVCGAGADPCSYYWTAFQAGPNIVVGTYAGNGAATQSIGGVGFSVDYVMIFGDGNKWPRNRTHSSSTVLGAGANFRIRNSGQNATSIPSLDADGFTVGNGNGDQEDANSSGITYHYVAFNEAPGIIKVGSYTGNGIDPRNVTGVGFRPAYVLVQSLDDGDQAFQKSDKMGGLSADFLDALLASRITGLLADGFEVSGDARVNASSEDYAYVAFTGSAVTQGHYRWRNDDGPEGSGTPPLQATALADVTTTSVTDVALSAMSLTPGAGDYLVWFSGSVENTTGTDDQFVSIYLDGAQIPHTERQATNESSIPPTSFPIATHAFLPGVTAGQTIDVRWRTTGGTATMHQRTLVVAPVVAADVTEVAATADLLTGSTSDVLATGMTVTPGTGDYLVWFSSSVQADTTGHQHVSLYRNGVAVPHTERESFTEDSIPDTSFPVATHAFLSGVGASEPIAVYWRTEAGTATMHERTLVVAKVTAADIFQASDTVDTLTTSGTDVVAPPLTLTPGAADYLAWFSASIESDDTSDQFATLYDNGTPLAHTVREITTESSIPDTSFPVASHAYIPGVGAGESIDVRWRTTSGNALMHERTLVLQKLASVAGASWAAAEDEKLLGLAKSTPIRLRFSLANGGSWSSGATSYLLQVAETAACNAGTYDTLATAGHWQIVGSAFVNEGDPSSNLAGISDDATTFVPGELRDASDATGAITLGADSFTEIEFVIEATASATDAGDYCFRLYDATNGQALTAYAAYAEIQLGGGTLTLSDHDAGQTPDRFTSAPSVTEVLYRFKLSRTPPVTISNLRVQYTTGGGVGDPDVTGGALYRDVNADGLLDGGDVPIQTGVAGASGQLAFTGLSEDPGAGTSYIVVATVNNLVPGDTTTFSLGAADIDEIESGVVEAGTITNAVHVANAARTVYYSVGTSLADLKSGTPTMTLVSGTASFTVPQPPNVGIGDEITYKTTDKVYISSRISSTVYTVTTATGLTPIDDTAPVDSITRAFNDLKTAALNADDAAHLNTSDLVANDMQLNLVGYNDGPDPSLYVRIEEPWITGPTNYIRVFTPTLPSEVGVSQRHIGVAGTGYRIAPVGPAGTDFFNFILVSTDFGYVRVEGVEIDGSGLTMGENVRGLMANQTLGNSQDVRFTHNLIHDLTNTTIDDSDNSRVVGIFLDATDASKVSDNIIYNLTSVSASANGQSRGIHSHDAGTTHHVYNNTLHNIRATVTTGSARGIYDEGGGTILARNNYVGFVESVNGSSVCFTGPFAAENNNVSADATAVGVGSVGGKNLYASYFVDVTPGSENFHILSDSNALWTTVGADLDTDPVLPVTDDIDGEPRHPTTPDIGADEASVVTNYRSIGTRPDYSIGTIDVTLNSAVVDGTGTAWLTENRGRGDRIDINGTDYTILSVLSDTRLVLTTPAAASFSGAYTISRQFSTLQAWEDCISGAGGCVYFLVSSASLVDDDRREMGVAYNDSVVPADPDFTAELFFEDAVTDATHTITLTAVGDNRHYGIPGAGVLYDCSTCPSGDTGIHIRNDYVTVEWLEVVGVNDGSASGGIAMRPAFNVLVQNVLVHGNANGIRMTGNAGKSMTVRNAIVYGNVDIGIEGDEVGDILVVENCTVFNNGQRGVWGALSTSTTTVRNTISMGHPAGDDIPSVGIQENNISGDGTASCSTCLSNRDYTDLSTPGAPPQGNGWVMFQSLTPGAENFHLRDNLSLNDAQDTGQDLSSSFLADIDAAPRVSPWDVGADDVSATTAVELIAFEATGFDGAVVVEWETGSEIDNLGFRLYRATAPEGPYETITPSLIAGLGSSPEGARYRHVDSDVANGVTYYYELEDVETTGATERHGPVFATPTAGAGSTVPAEETLSPTPITYGEPDGNGLRVLRRGRYDAVVELVTEGFYAEPQEDGSVLLSIPDFELLESAGYPVIPVIRPWVEAALDRGVSITSVRVASVVSFDGLRPSGAIEHAVVSSPEGGLRVSRRGRRRASSSEGVFPAEVATLLSTGFQGSTKKAQLQLAPLRWDAASGELHLARRVVVHLSFLGRETMPARKGRRYRGDGEKVLARLATNERGLYVVRYEDIVKDRRLTIDEVRLSRRGKPVPFHLVSPSGRFSPGASLYFVGEGGDANPYGNEAVYELETGVSGGGPRMEVADASPGGFPVSHYWQRQTYEENRIYSPSFLGASDLWRWEVLVAPVTKRYPFSLTALARTVEPARLELALQGTSDFEANPDHHVRVYVNGTLVADTSWDGKRLHALEVEIPPGVLRDGVNGLEIESVGDTEALHSVTMLDRFAILYPREAAATEGRLEGRFAESGTARVTGAGENYFVVDTTDADAPRWLEGLESSASGNGRGLVRFEVGENRVYLVASESAVPRPEIRPAGGPGLAGVQSGVDYLVIGPRALLGEADRLVDHRRAQGLLARAVALEDVFDVFGHGERRPDAVRDFIGHVYHEWSGSGARLRYVLLLGDATYDYKGYLGNAGDTNVFPPLMVETSYIWTVSDPALAAVNGDDRLPDVAIGRLAASDAVELRGMVSKILAYENGDTGLDRGLFLVADDSDRGGTFDSDVQAIATGLLASHDVRRIRLAELGASTARRRILEAFDGGASLMSYVGHGGIHLWADENLLNVADVPSLRAQSQQPILLTMNCLNGYFHFPYSDSLVEELVKAEDKGAVAAFSPSGFSQNVPADRLHRFLLDALLNRGHERLGDAVLEAQKAYAETGMYEELLLIYHVIGDPALVLR